METTKSSQLQNITGQRFGRLTAISLSHFHRFPSGKRQPVWKFKCDCGKTTKAYANLVKRGHTRSCGCLGDESRRTSTKTHGDSGKRLWIIWRSMLQRCNDPNSPSYRHYGQKGIRVEWASYEEFKRDMGTSYQESLTIGRKDNSKNYNKDNCQWETYAEQNRNYSRNVRLTFNGITMVKSDWADRMGIKRPTLDRRLLKGWSVEKALTTPVKPLKRQYGIQ